MVDFRFRAWLDLEFERLVDRYCDDGWDVCDDGDGE
jgi:hypothetical protein